MKKVCIWVILLAYGFTSSAQESAPAQRPARRGQSAGYASRDASVLSMMGWGILLAAGIATLCALVEDNSTSSGGQSH
jgi:hypothetical protein